MSNPTKTQAAQKAERDKKLWQAMLAITQGVYAGQTYEHAADWVARDAEELVREWERRTQERAE